MAPQVLFGNTATPAEMCVVLLKFILYNRDFYLGPVSWTMKFIPVRAIKCLHSMDECLFLTLVSWVATETCVPYAFWQLSILGMECCHIRWSDMESSLLWCETL